MRQKRHTQFDVPEKTKIESGMEHLIVTGEAEDSVESEQRAYLDHRRGMFLYSRGEYAEALPYLMSSAKHGYKDFPGSVSPSLPSRSSAAFDVAI